MSAFIAKLKSLISHQVVTAVPVDHDDEVTFETLDVEPQEESVRVVVDNSFENVQTKTKKSRELLTNAYRICNLLQNAIVRKTYDEKLKHLETELNVIVYDRIRCESAKDQKIEENYLLLFGVFRDIMLRTAQEAYDQLKTVPSSSKTVLLSSERRELSMELNTVQQRRSKCVPYLIAWHRQFVGRCENLVRLYLETAFSQ